MGFQDINATNGTRKIIAWNPNLEESIINAVSNIPVNKNKVSPVTSLNKNVIKNKLAASSDDNRGVKHSIRGPVDRRENHIGVNT